MEPIRVELISRKMHAADLLLTLVVGLCVFVTGASVMIYEFLAVRFLQRDFGGSLDVWGSVVAVCLAGLTLGYVLGGLLADRFGSARMLGVAMFIGGATGFCMEALAVRTGKYLLHHVQTALAWQPHIAAAASSFLPILALGAVLPQAIRLQARRIEGVGTTSGWIAAVSSAGSIAGVLITTMVLLPHIGVRETLYGTSAVLVALGALMLPWRKRAVAVVLLVVGLLPTSATAQIRFERYSAYHHIIVQDVRGERLLRFDNALQSTMSLANPYAGGFEYTDFFHVPMVLDPPIRNVLFLGLGGGTGPKAFLRDYPQVHVDVAEIDPVVVKVARTFFDLPVTPRLNVAVEDGRVFLERHQRTYGAIIVDAYASGPHGAYIPFPLVTREFFRLVWSRLKPGGCLVYNVIGVYRGRGSNNVRDIRTTIASVFPVEYAFQARSSLNTVLVAQKVDASLRADAAAGKLQPWPRGPWLRYPLDGTQLAGLARELMTRRFPLEPGLDLRMMQLSPIQGEPYRGRVLTDNFAPLDLAPGWRR